MFVEEYGKENKKIIVMLHGLYNVHSFRKQYELSKKYKIVIPHLMGFGKNAGKNIFNTEKQVKDLYDIVKSFDSKVTLVGFSLGAEIAFKLLCEHKELFHSVILISPWLIKDDKKFLQEIKISALKGLNFIKKRWLCYIMCFISRIPRFYIKDFVNQIHNINKDTVLNAVDSGISFKTVNNFDKINIPVLTIVGEKELSVIKDSAEMLKKINNEYCKIVCVKSAGHNIPTKFSKQLNMILDSVCSKV